MPKRFADHPHKLGAVPDFYKRKAPRLTTEEAEFVKDKIAAGLTNSEVSRMLFRKFGRTLTNVGVQYHRGK